MLEPFSNFFIEKHLAKFGVEVHRPLTVAHTIRDITFYDWQVARTLRTTRPYVTGRLGGEGTENVASALRYAKQGFDGLIHVKPFGCMPEISAMPALYRISEDFHFPIVYFSFDSLTSETGIKTRLEAFYDMMVMRKERHA
ncbi:MAG: hypothetical protein IPM16_20650 [Chloroflexi bacterium]|nr:hypothetical protein [Chloroflexota bacterium]